MSADHDAIRELIGAWLRETRAGKFQQTVTTGPHQMLADDAPYSTRNSRPS